MIEKIAVLGAGTMGHGIAETFAMNGYTVNLYENYEPVRNTVMDTIKDELTFLCENGVLTEEAVGESLSRIHLFADLAEAVGDADYVIEATPEKMELKQELFAELDRLCKAEAILASNTSSLPLMEMAAKLPEERKTRMMVCHWYNPAHLMPIAELSFFGNIEDATYKEVEELYNKAGKQTVKVLKDIPGMVANRIQQAVAREVFALMEDQVASPEDIDKALKFGPAFRYATTGQLEVADMGGLDIWCTVGDNLLSVMDSRKEANPILREKVKAKKLGLKTGEGFFKYPQEEVEHIKNVFNKRLIVQLKASQNYIN
ncbi:3-hydroxyacyl-CoA dehydrogenase family protein [Aminipila butyrica]|uniref:3-hydroxyacyl-CoA dehydrogenase family protein n=1 Tax=Aminipila butyrica TaxID=433296 RepID=A0A858BV81_9FIRM|nr:3-hydroxyacyl-CoA dehydrogenase family protein [Aminipila butyrica]QIB68965.1 3-hydroxyacyl-CoA dehydrogenase family protein [Aminipila butyrica]